jgi:proline dehydrogenase
VSRLAFLRRRALFGLATNERFEATARALPRIERAARERAWRYVAGESLADALTVSARLADGGIAAAIDFFGEQVSDAATAEAATDGYVALAQALARADSTATVAIDLSHVGLDISTGFCREQLGRIAAALAGRRLDVGAEDSPRTAATLALVLELAGSGTPLQMTVQANLRRTAHDWQPLVAAGVAIRLVKGAYVEDAATALRFGDEVDLAFLRLARDVHAAGGRLALATHDPVLREALLGLDGVSVEMLLGVRSADARELVARGIPVRLYVPYGRDWFRYWMRRVAEAQGA